MTAINPRLRAAHIVRLTAGIQLIGPDFERFGQLFMDELLGIPLTHAGLNMLGFPVGGVVDTQSNDGAWVAEYSAEKGYFSGKMAKAAKDLKHALKTEPKARKIVLLSAQLKVKSRATAFIKAAKAAKGMSRKSIELWGAEEIATRIVDQLLTSDRAVARLSPYLPVLSAVRDEQASSLQMERPPTGALPRNAVNDALATALASSACVVISGHGGAGKSVAAAAFADRHKSRYHNLIWLKGRDVPTLESLTAVAIARAGDSRNVAFLLGSRPTLLVIDDDVSGLDRTRLSALCSKGSHIIVTTRSGGGYQIPPFTEEEARQVLGRNTPTPCPDPVFALIWATVGGHPLTYGLINGVVVSGGTWEEVQADCEAIGDLDDKDGRPGRLADRLLARVLDVMGRVLAFFHWRGKGDCDEGFARAALRPAGLRRLRDACLTTPDRKTVVRLHDVVHASLATVASRLPVLDDEWLDQLDTYIADVATSGDGVPFWTVSKNLDAPLRAAIAGGDRRPAFIYALLEVTAPTALDPVLLEDPAMMADRLLADSATAVRPIATMAIIETIEAGYLHRKTTIDKATAESALAAHLPVFDRMSGHPGLTEQQKSEISHHKAKALLRLNRKPDAIALFERVLANPHPLHEARLQLVKLLRDDPTRASDVENMTRILLEGYGGLGAVSTSVFLATIESLPWKDESWRGEMIKAYEIVIETGLVRATNLGIDQGYRALASIGRYWARHDSTVFLRVFDKVPPRTPDASMADDDLFAYGELLLEASRLRPSDKDDLQARALAIYRALAAPDQYQSERLADLLLDMGQPEAVIDLLEPLQGTETSPFGQFRLSRAYLAVGRLDDAETAITRGAPLLKREFYRRDFEAQAAAVASAKAAHQSGD